MQKTSEQKNTTVGNYFVSNYPPYSFWTPDQAPDAHWALDQPPQKETPLGVYLHIPFCRKRCHFCYFRVYTGVKSAEIRGYIDAAIHELKIYKGKPAIAGRKPSFVYFGGGTPSFLSTKQLQLLVSSMQSTLSWEEAEEITFECEPGTLTESKIRFIKDIGVTRLSLGVENFDDHILGINGRAHRSKEIWRAYETAKNCQFNQINIDLIAGMIGETDENWETCIDKIIEMSPDNITIYQMEIPYNTNIFKMMKEHNKDIAPVADWDTKRRWVSDAFEKLESVGYSITSAYTAVKNPNKSAFVYRDQLWKGADMMALGVASFSHVNGTHYQNEHQIEAYLNRLKENKLPIYRALTPSQEELMIRELILQFKLGKVDFTYFKRKFDTDISEKFSSQLSVLQDRGFANASNGVFTLNRNGLVRVDELLHDFFLEKHKDARYT